jgi:hypothetical protein
VHDVVTVNKRSRVVRTGASPVVDIKQMIVFASLLAIGNHECDVEVDSNGNDRLCVGATGISVKRSWS